jgi:hypothetical protein
MEFSNTSEKLFISILSKVRNSKVTLGNLKSWFPLQKYKHAYRYCIFHSELYYVIFLVTLLKKEKYSFVIFPVVTSTHDILCTI